MYRYFVSFKVLDDGFGNHEIKTKRKIIGITDVQEISRDIERSLGLKENSLVIMNFQLFED